MSFDINTLIDSLTNGEGQEKQASEAVVVNAPTVAEELKSVLMTKSASEVTEEAGALGRMLAQRLLEKAASENPAVSEVVVGDQMSALTASVETAIIKEASEISPQPQINTEHNAASAAAQDHVDNAALQSGGTVEQQTAESIQKGLSTASATATSEDLVRKVEDKAEDSNMLKAAAVNELVSQGLSFYEAGNLIAEADAELQKEAAFAELTTEGYNFEDATALIKAASEADFEMSKEASLSDLLSQGYRFDDAVEMVKEAGARSFVPKVAKKGLGLKTKIAAGAGAAAVAAGGAVAAQKKMTKEAAFSELLEAGYTFDQALATVQA